MYIDYDSAFIGSASWWLHSVLYVKMVLNMKAEADVEIINKAENFLGRIILWILKQT